MGHLKKTIFGITWIGGFRMATRLGAFARIAILARLLSPHQFGIFGISALLLTFLETLTESGANVVMIQDKNGLKKYINSAWILSIVRGSIISIIILVVSRSISNFFQTPDAVGAVRLIALVSFVRGFINPARVSFLKNLDFNKEVKFSSAIFVVDFMVTIIVTYIRKSPEGLVWGLVSGALLELVLSFLVIKPVPRLEYNNQVMKKLFNRGKWVTGSSIFGYLFEQGDDVFVGRIIGTHYLGIYQIAYKISTLPITEVTKVVNQVIFPIFSRFADDKRRLHSNHKKTLLATSLIIVPIGMVIFIYPQQIVDILLGNNWKEVVPILRVLSLFGVIRALTLLYIPVFDSSRRQRYVTHISMLSMIVMLVLLTPLIKIWGVLGASWAVLIGSICAVPLTLYYYRKTFSS
jgi:O-antigen/teichoic acid export membrane protein